MNRKIIAYFEGVVLLRVKGKKIDRFLSYLYKLKLNMLEVKHLDKENILIRVFSRDLDKVMSMKTTYKVEVVGYEGKLKLKELFKKHLFLLMSVIMGYIFLLFLSNVIFEVEVIHSNATIRKLLTNELAEYNIKQWGFKKKFEELEKIKKEILIKHKDKLEWFEIESLGTRYIVKVEERKINDEQKNYIFQDIVSNKNAIIMKIEATEGEIVKRKNDYVKKGDIIISGKIMKGEEVLKIVQANGRIYGEVWYNIKVEHPLIYQNSIETGKKKKVYEIVFLDYRLSLFNFSPFSSKKSSYSNIVSNPLIPFKIVKDMQKEMIVEDEVYTDGEALVKAERQATEKMEDYLKEDEYIISQRKLKYYVEDQKLFLEMFFKVCENIGEPREITE